MASGSKTCKHRSALDTLLYMKVVEQGLFINYFNIITIIFPVFQRLPQNGRISQGLNGDLYFSNVQPEDSRDFYICYARFNLTQTIHQKQPISLKVLASKLEILFGNWYDWIP